MNSDRKYCFPEFGFSQETNLYATCGLGVKSKSVRVGSKKEACRYGNRDKKRPFN